MPIIAPTLPNDGETIDASDVNNPFNAILGVLNGGIDSNNIAPGGVTLAQLAASLTPFLVPTAAITPFAGSSAPTGWLLCDGSSLLRASYPALFAAISTAYGSVDGTHFNVPDLRGRVTIGREAMGGTTSGRLERSTTITTVNANPAITVASATGLAPGMFITAAGVTAGTKILSISGTTVTMTANATAGASGVAARFSMLGNDPEVLGAAGGEDVHTLLIAELASHTHDTGLKGSGGSNSNARESFDGTANNASPRFTAPTGSDQPHNTLPPSLVTNFIIKT